MTIPAIYISLYILTVILCFIKCKWTVKFKKILISVHLFLFFLLEVDVFIINLKGVWLDRLIVVTFLLTASTTFALYRKTVRLWQKVYFGFFLFYPAVAATTFLMDQIMFVVVANLLLVSLIVPETRFNGKDYEIREQVGLIFPGTSQMPHILENIGADAVRFSSDELKQFNTNVAKAESKGERLPKMVLDFSNAEALPKK